MRLHHAGHSLELSDVTVGVTLVKAGNVAMGNKIFPQSAALSHPSQSLTRLRVTVLSLICGR